MAAGLVAFGTVVVACSSDDDPKQAAVNTPPITASSDAGPNEALNLAWNPTFEADYNHLTANPAANAVTSGQRDKVTVTPTTLEFPAEDAEDVRDWELGKIVVGGPGAGNGSNPLGFARRVVAVNEQDGKVVVTTETVGIEDIVYGDFQVKYDPATSTEVDVTKLDPALIKQLYYTGRPIAADYPDLTTNFPYSKDAASYPLGQPDLIDDFTHAVSSIPEIVTYTGNATADGFANFASGLADKANQAYGDLLPSTFGGSVSLTDDFIGELNHTSLFKDGAFNYTKTLGGTTPMAINLKATAFVDAKMDFKPGFQVGLDIPNPLSTHPGQLRAWMNVDSHADARIHLTAEMIASIVSADGVEGPDVQKHMAADPPAAERIQTAAREALFGNPDLNPKGTWVKNLYISKPRTSFFTIAEIPVVFTTTAQVDLECSFSAQASVNADIDFSTSANFKFKGGIGQYGADVSEPYFSMQTSKNIQITGGGALALSCGLVPRINVLLYDAIGINAGIKTQAIGRATYASMCSATSTAPTGRIDVSLAAEVDVVVGGRVQLPGSSAAGGSGTSLGVDFAERPIYTWQKDLGGWTFPVPGWGYCTPLCTDGKVSGKETDVDCGGGACPACGDAKKCQWNTDCLAPGVCVGGTCKVTTCLDRVKDKDETDVDCGGKCDSKCGESKWCSQTADCATGLFCSKATKTCIRSSCDDGVKDGTESGVDCGGECGKCAVGTAASVASDCASGFFDGHYCRENKCQNRTQDADETGIDCGNATCGKCPLGQGCTTSADCLDGYKSNFCDPGTHLCAVNPNPTCFDGVRNQDEGAVDCGGPCAKKCDTGAACFNGFGCLSDHCALRKCAAPTCADKSKNGDEGDADCGGSCSTKCANGKTCNVPTDCTSGACPSSTRVCEDVSTCFDGKKNGDETDTDCGKACNNKSFLCDTGKTCKTADDCLSSNCVSGACAAPLPVGVVFVTTGTYIANFPGLAGADADCQAAAASGSLGGTWKAFLSDSTTTAKDRMTVRAGGYMLLDGTVVAKTGNDFFSYAHLAPIDRTEANVALASPVYVWTGTAPSNEKGMWCNDWTKQFGDLPPIGVTDGIDSSWTKAPQTSFCDGNYHLYCVLQ